METAIAGGSGCSKAALESADPKSCKSLGTEQVPSDTST